MSHWTILYSEPRMHEALLTLPFALGLSDLGTTTLERLPIKVLSIDGIAPTPENVANGRYPFVKTLRFVWRENTLPVSARAFVGFVQSENGAELLRVTDACRSLICVEALGAALLHRLLDALPTRRDRLVHNPVAYRSSVAFSRRCLADAGTSRDPRRSSSNRREPWRS
jgi:hypothetical protein